MPGSHLSMAVQLGWGWWAAACSPEESKQVHRALCTDCQEQLAHGLHVPVRTSGHAGQHLRWACQPHPRALAHPVPEPGYQAQTHPRICVPHLLAGRC